MKDCLGLVEPDLAEAIEYFHEYGDELGIQQKYEDLQYEFKSYEESNESYRFCLNDVQSVAEELIKDIENGKRINKENLLEKLNYIVDTILNEI
jgi:hypothetical protein